MCEESEELELEILKLKAKVKRLQKRISRIRNLELRAIDESEEEDIQIAIKTPIPRKYSIDRCTKCGAELELLDLGRVRLGYCNLCKHRETL